ncbi:MAG TPA: RDD family protein [Rhodocyclaceae bacterium]|nr:RDD family protein [Rhodocyclaceae bacterium]
MITSTAPIRRWVELASLRRRLASMLYEGLPVFGIAVAGCLVPQVAIGMIFKIALPGILIWLHLFLVLGVYFVFVWHYRGQTLAMQTWSLQLVDARSGKTPALSQLVLRYVLAWPSLLLITSGLGILWAAMVDRDRQFPHDRLSGIRVIFNPVRPME